MENLRIIAGILKHKEENYTGVYFVPEKWNYLGLTDVSRQPGRAGEIVVNPYVFFHACLQSILAKCVTASGAAPAIEKGTGEDEGADGGEKTGREEPDNRANLCRRVIYCMFPRAFSAWRHYDREKIVPGTFLKSLCLLPLLQEFGVDMIYLLPVFKCSDQYKKGEAGSPYAIKNLYRLDENLHDELLGAYTEELLHRECQAFVEACHLLGMKVLLDFVFRTVSRDHDLIKDHPDWFYWIKKKSAADFRVPVVEKEKRLTVLQDRSLKNLYTCAGIKEYLGRFRPSPDRIDAGRWQQVRERHTQSGVNILTLIEEEFGITTVPGFSDILNDPQPPWTDVTYLKYYFDLHTKARRYVSRARGGEEYSPFILPDGVCLNLYQGEVVNQELWDYVVGVIPFYQQEFGIDGARIDMGHVMPASLMNAIVRAAREKNPRFIFWSEEFSVKNSAAAREGGFDFITGSLWYLYKTHQTPGFQRRVLGEVLGSALPVTAAPETADTPRFAHLYRGKALRELLLLLNFFLPNTVPFINNGLELAEIQPMNLGLENTEEGRFVLERNDPLYGKLAFFDHYCFHWLNEEHDRMIELLATAARLRGRFIEILAEKANFLPGCSLNRSKKILFFCYRRKPHGLLFFLANKDQEQRARVNLDGLLAGRKGEVPGVTVTIVYAGGRLRDERRPAGEIKTLGPGEVVIGYTVDDPARV